ncbi:MAG: hypothetical protein M1828_003198 [Chrysothrix sp. TS-e1954]|nr:MAG: hypothetical protein M1828_003198 [Chrysothrix sp. TS-e1954]
MAISLSQHQHPYSLPQLDALRASSLPPLDRKRSSFDLGSDRSLLNTEASPYAQRLQDAFQTPTNENKGLQLPGLAALASIASTHSGDREGTWRTPPPPPPPPFLFSANLGSSNTMNATTAPGQGAGSPYNCNTNTTPLWRRDDSGSILCNACGLFLKLHGRPRPISLKTDVIKSRNRVKVPSSQQQGGQSNGQQNGSVKRKSTTHTTSLAASHPSIAHAPHPPTDNPPSHPGSPNGTPSTYPPPPSHPSNIAPQHMFDSSLDTSYHEAGFIPARNGSPRSLLNGNGGGGGSPVDLAEDNARLRTRVSELEVINELFRGRVAELEASEGEARRGFEDLRARLEALEGREGGRVAVMQGGGMVKRRKLSEQVEEEEVEEGEEGEARRAAEIAAAAVDAR